MYLHHVQTYKKVYWCNDVNPPRFECIFYVYLLLLSSLQYISHFFLRMSDAGIMTAPPTDNKIVQFIFFDMVAQVDWPQLRERKAAKHSFYHASTFGYWNFFYLFIFFKQLKKTQPFGPFCQHDHGCDMNLP